MLADSSSPFEPLPVRARDTLEILDTSAKLYKRYFWVLLAWSAVSDCGSVLGVLLSLQSTDPSGATVFTWFLSLFLKPLMVGASACCIAAAVRGQRMGFRQCWNFTKPRYWATMGQYLLTWVLGFLAIIALIVIGSLVVALAVWATASAGMVVKVLVFALFTVVGLGISSVLGSVILAWIYITPLVVCLEDDRRGGSAQGRSWELLRAGWGRVTAIITVVSLALLVGMAIVGGFAMLLFGIGKIPEMLNGSYWENGRFLDALVKGNFVILVAQILLRPVFLLLIGVLYLDLRVRKEALDLEWAAHVSAPQIVPELASQMAPQASEPTFEAPTPGGERPDEAPEMPPSSFST